MPSGQRDAKRDAQPRRNEGAIDRCPGSGVVLASRVIVKVSDKQMPSGQRDAKRGAQPRRNEGAIDRCPGSGVVFANRVAASVCDKNLSVTGYGCETKRGNYS